MSLSLYQSSVPVYERGLNAFLAILDKAEEHAQARKFDPNNYLAMRLSPDMLPLVRQVQELLRSRQELVVPAGRQGPARQGGQGDDSRRIARRASTQPSTC